MARVGSDGCRQSDRQAADLLARLSMFGFANGDYGHTLTCAHADSYGDHPCDCGLLALSQEIAAWKGAKEISDATRNDRTPANGQRVGLGQGRQEQDNPV